MHATFTQDQIDIGRTVRAILEGERVGARAALESGWSAPECDDTLLSGFSALGVPEAAGGVGSSLVDLLVAVETIGESLVPSRFPAHAAAVQLLVGAGAVEEDVLGEGRTLSLAVDAPRHRGWAATRADDPLRRTLVPFAEQADDLVVAGARGTWVAEVLEVRRRESFDPALPLSDVSVAEPTRTDPVGSGLQRATLVVAAQLCGVAQGAIDLAAEYARTRQQFGRPIGSFQAVAFQLADAVATRKAAWDLTLYAAWAVENGRPDAEIQVHAAKAAAGKAAVFAAERCIQVHGGMGITREADPHLYLRRSFVLDAVAGGGAWHRRRVGALRIAGRRLTAGA